jgi:hypothetical protein
MTNLARIIDDLGILKAQIADLAKQEKALKDALADLDPGTYAGEVFQLSISQSERETIDQDAVRAAMSRQWLAAHTKVTPVRTLKVAARSAKALAA